MPVEVIRCRRPPFEITDPLLPAEAERLFLARFKELSVKPPTPLPNQPVMQSAFPGGGEPHIPASNRRRKTRGAPGLSVGLRRCPGYFGGRKGYGGRKKYIFVPGRPIRSREIRPLRPSPAPQFQPVLVFRMLSRSDRGSL